MKLSIDCKKTATGNGNLQPEIEINEYSSSKQEGQHPLTGQRVPPISGGT